MSLFPALLTASRCFSHLTHSPWWPSSSCRSSNVVGYRRPSSLLVGTRNDHLRFETRLGRSPQNCVPRVSSITQQHDNCYPTEPSVSVVPYLPTSRWTTYSTSYNADFRFHQRHFSYSETIALKTRELLLVETDSAFVWSQ